MRQNHELYNHLLKLGCSFYYGSTFSRFSNEKMSPWLTILCASKKLSFSIYITGLDRLWQDVTKDVTKDVTTPPELTAEHFELFLQTLINLPEVFKQAVHLHYFQGLSYAEIAKTLSISESLAKHRVRVSISLFNLLLACKPKNPV